MIKNSCCLNYPQEHVDAFGGSIFFKVGKMLKASFRKRDTEKYISEMPDRTGDISIEVKSFTEHLFKTATVLINILE